MTKRATPRQNNPTGPESAGLARPGAVGGNRGTAYDLERPSTTFADVAGYEGAKRAVTEVVDFLKEPGAGGPTGVLIVGPPGTGKTLLARAVAGEAAVPLLSVTGSGFVEAFGGGAARVRDLFADARRRAPAIVFIDEIDAIGRRVGGRIPSTGEQDQILDQLLADMDGSDPASGVVVIAATNCPEALDPALLRPGRFDRQVVIPLPTPRERGAILAVHGRGKPLDPGVDLDVVARAAPGFCGAELADLVDEAAIEAGRAGRQVIVADDFTGACDRLLLGRRDDSGALLPQEKHALAVHEGGRALLAAVSEHTDPAATVTILPVGRPLGATGQQPADERRRYSEDHLRDALTVRTGGRAAQRIVLGEVSTGAANDLADATRLAARIVRQYGTGPAGQRVIDEEVGTLLRQAEQRATAILTDRRQALDRITALLLEYETIDGTDVDRIVRSIPGAGAARPAGDRQSGRPGDRAQLRIRTVHTGHETVVHLAGEVDIATIDALRAVLRQEITGPARRPRLSVDLSQVTFMDAGGLGALVHWQNLARAVGIELVVCDAHRFVRRIIHITGLTDRLGLT